MTRREKIQFIVTRSLGNFLLLLSLYGVVATFGPAVAAETQFRINQVRGIHYKVGEGTKETNETQEGGTSVSSGPSVSSIPFETPSSSTTSNDNEELLNPIDTQFGILIPKIGANTKVFPNVDPQNSAEFLPVLRQGVAHAKGSVFPGMQGNVYVFAHSASTWWEAGQHNAIFYLIKDLSEGDEIAVFFENKRYDYVVSQKVIADANDISFIARDHNGEERLVLQTCWPPGTSWKRLYVVAKPKGS